MRILQVNKFLYRRAGAEGYMLDLAELLASHGHEVALWGTSEGYTPHTTRCQVFQDLLMSEAHFDKSEGLAKDAGKVGRMIWSREAAEKFETLIKRWRPDVVHLHNIYHHLSPSIIAVCRRRKIPVVQTLHDFKLICPNYKLFTKHDVCERCFVHQYWNAVSNRCLQGSFSASAAAATEMWIHRALGVYEKGVAHFLTPSRFLRDLLIRWGKDGGKITHVPLFTFPTSPTSVETLVGLVGNSILFAGRITEEKGIWLLLEIARALPKIPFKIAGTGPEFESVKCKVKSEKLLNIEMLGFQEKAQMQKLIAGARLVIVPSIWYENYPLAVLEAQAAGKAVLASDSGGIPEMIENWQTGFLARRGKAADFIDKIKEIYYDEALLDRVGKAAAEAVGIRNDPERHYQEMLKIYENVQIHH